MTGLTIDYLVPLLKEHLSFIGSGFFVQLEQKSVRLAFMVHVEHCGQSFLYCSLGVWVCSEVNTDNVRLKEAIVKLSSDVPFCCVGSEKSLEKNQ